MAEPTYRWVNVYDNSVALHNTRGAADVLGYSRRRCDRYRVDNGILVYDPEPVSRHVDSLRWIAVDSGNNFRVLTGFVDGEKPAHGDDEFAVVCRVRDKAADDAMVETMQLRLAGLEEQRQRAIAAESQVAALTRERDDWQMSAEWGWGDVGHGTELLKKAEDRIAELERQLAEAKARERYPEVADFLDAFGAVGWSLSYNPNSDPSKLASAWTRALPRDVYFNRPTIAAACRAALAAKEKTDG